MLLVYHDKEWGVPVHADRKHFEYLTLEVMQSPAKSSARKRERNWTIRSVPSGSSLLWARRLKAKNFTTTEKALMLGRMASI